VCAADPTGLFQASAQSLAGSMQTNREIAWGDLQLLRHTLRRFLVEINSLDQLGIVRMKHRQQPVEAGAGSGLHRIDWGLLIVSGCTQFLKKGFIATSLRPFRPIIVDECVAKDLIEPGHYTFIISNGMVALNGTDHTLLQEILSQSLVTDTTTEKHLERRLMLKKPVDDVVQVRLRSGVRCGEGTLAVWFCLVSFIHGVSHCSQPTVSPDSAQQIETFHIPRKAGFSPHVEIKAILNLSEKELDEEILKRGLNPQKFGEETRRVVAEAIGTHNEQALAQSRQACQKEVASLKHVRITSPTSIKDKLVLLKACLAN